MTEKSWPVDEVDKEQNYKLCGHVISLSHNLTIILERNVSLQLLCRLPINRKRHIFPAVLSSANRCTGNKLKQFI